MTYLRTLLFNLLHLNQHTFCVNRSVRRTQTYFGLTRRVGIYLVQRGWKAERRETSDFEYIATKSGVRMFVKCVPTLGYVGETVVRDFAAIRAGVGSSAKLVIISAAEVAPDALLAAVERSVTLLSWDQMSEVEACREFK